MVRFSMVLVGLGLSLGGCFISEQEIREEYRSARDQGGPDDQGIPDALGAPDEGGVPDAQVDQGTCTIRQQEGGSSLFLPNETGYTPIARPAIRGDGAGGWWVWTVSIPSEMMGLANRKIQRHKLKAGILDRNPTVICDYRSPEPQEWQTCVDRPLDVGLGSTEVDSNQQRFMLTDLDDQLAGSGEVGTFMRFIDGTAEADAARVIYLDGTTTRLGFPSQEVDIITPLANGSAHFQDLAAGRMNEGGVCVAGLVYLNGQSQVLMVIVVDDSTPDPFLPTFADIPPDDCHLANIAQTATGWLLMCHHLTDDVIAVYHAPPDCRTWTRVEADQRLVVGQRTGKDGGKFPFASISLVPGPGGGLVGAWATDTEVAVAQFDADGAIRAFETINPIVTDDSWTEPQAVALAVDGANYLVAYTMEDGRPPLFRLLSCAP